MGEAEKTKMNTDALYHLRERNKGLGRLERQRIRVKKVRKRSLKMMRLKMESEREYREGNGGRLGRVHPGTNTWL